MSTSANQFLATHSPDDTIRGIFQLAGAKRELGLIEGSTTITIGSVPEKSEYVRYMRNARERIAAYEANPNAVIAEHAREKIGRAHV